MTMKRTILLLATIITSVVGFSQATITLSGSTTDISGTVQTITTEADVDTHLDLHFNNVSGGEKFWKITRVRLNTPPAGWQDWVCWGLVGESGLCYNYSPTNPWTTSDPVQHEYADENTGEIIVESGLLNGESALAQVHCRPDVVNNGAVTYRYYVHEQGGSYEDSVDVLFTTVVLGVKEQKPVAAMSAYPNPASSVLTVNATGMSDNFTIRISDVLGKVVYEEVSSVAKKVDVSEFKNGVYLVTVLEKGATVQTKRVVVKH